MYRAPVDEISFTLKHVCGLGDVQNTAHHAELGDDLVDAILNEAGRFASEEIAPLNSVADNYGTPFENGEVSTPPGGVSSTTIGSREAGTACPLHRHPEGRDCRKCSQRPPWRCGIQVPWPLPSAPTLTIGAIEAMEKHASEELKAKYLEKWSRGSGWAR